MALSREIRASLAKLSETNPTHSSLQPTGLEFAKELNKASFVEAHNSVRVGLEKALDSFQFLYNERETEFSRLESLNDFFNAEQMANRQSSTLFYVTWFSYFFGQEQTHACSGELDAQACEVSRKRLETLDLQLVQLAIDIKNSTQFLGLDSTGNETLDFQIESVEENYAEFVHSTFRNLQSGIKAAQDGLPSDAFVKHLRVQARFLANFFSSPDTTARIRELKTFVSTLEHAKVSLGHSTFHNPLEQRLNIFKACIDLVESNELKNLVRIAMDDSLVHGGTLANFAKHDLIVIGGSIAAAVLASEIVVVSFGAALPLYATCMAMAAGGLLGKEGAKEILFSINNCLNSSVTDGQYSFQDRSLFGKWQTGVKIYKQDTGTFESLSIWDLGWSYVKDFIISSAANYLTILAALCGGALVTRVLSNTRVLEKLAARSDMAKFVLRKLSQPENLPLAQREKVQAFTRAWANRLKEGLRRELPDEIVDEVREDWLGKYLEGVANFAFGTSINNSTAGANCANGIGFDNLAAVVLGSVKRARVRTTNLRANYSVDSSSVYQKNLDLTDRTAEEWGFRKLDLGDGRVAYFDAKTGRRFDVASKAEDARFRNIEIADSKLTVVALEKGENPLSKIGAKSINTTDLAVAAYDRDSKSAYVPRLRDGSLSPTHLAHERTHFETDLAVRELEKLARNHQEIDGLNWEAETQAYLAELGDNAVDGTELETVRKTVRRRYRRPRECDNAKLPSVLAASDLSIPPFSVLLALQNSFNPLHPSSRLIPKVGAERSNCELGNYRARLGLRWLGVHGLFITHHTSPYCSPAMRCSNLLWLAQTGQLRATLSDLLSLDTTEGRFVAPEDRENILKEQLLSLSQEARTSLLVRRQELFQGKLPEVQRDFQRIKSEVGDFLTRTHRKCGLTTPLESILDRLETVELLVVDPTVDSVPTFGMYCVVSHICGISAFLEQTQRRNVIFHELLHAAAGSGVLKVGLSSSAPSSASRPFLIRQGLSGLDSRSLDSFDWLNEGLVEYLANLALKRRGYADGHPFARQIFSRIVREAGVSKLLDIYFSDAEASDLQARLAKVEEDLLILGPGVLSQLEDIARGSNLRGDSLDQLILEHLKEEFPPPGPLSRIAHSVRRGWELIFSRTHSVPSGFVESAIQENAPPATPPTIITRKPGLSENDWSQYFKLLPSMSYPLGVSVYDIGLLCHVLGLPATRSTPERLRSLYQYVATAGNTAYLERALAEPWLVNSPGITSALRYLLDYARALSTA